METKKKYTQNGFSNHALVAKTKVTIMFANRDAELFANYGINKDYIDSVTAKVQKLENLSSFEMDKETKVLSTKMKNDAKNEFYKSLRSIRKRFSTVFPVSSTEYKQTMNFKLSNASDNVFISYAEKIIDGIRTYSSKLSSVRINAEQINYLENQLADFKNIVNENSFVQQNTDDNTQLRNQAMADVYSELSYLCKIGKIIWKDSNAARYKDYILSKRRSSTSSNHNTDSPPSTGEIIYSKRDSLE